MSKAVTGKMSGSVFSIVSRGADCSSGPLSPRSWPDRLPCSGGTTTRSVDANRSEHRLEPVNHVADIFASRVQARVHRQLGAVVVDDAEVESTVKLDLHPRIVAASIWIDLDRRDVRAVVEEAKRKTNAADRGALEVGDPEARSEERCVRKVKLPVLVDVRESVQGVEDRLLRLGLAGAP
jgi:hypothetical protein